MKTITTTLVAAALAASLAGCGTGSVSKSDVESKVKDVFSSKIPGTITVSCDGDLKAEKGKTERCIITADDGSRLGVTVSVTDVKDGKADMHFQADDKPMSN